MRPVRVAITMVRDEADIIGYSLSHMLTQVDHVIVADNLSIDNTRQILEGFDRVTIINDREEGYYQSTKVTRLAHLAGDMGADWVVPFDADEFVYLPPLDDDVDVYWTHPWVHVPHAEDPVDEPDPAKRMGWRMVTPEEHPKIVAFRYHPEAVIHMGQHGIVWPGARRCQGGWIHHYQWRSLEQARRKVTNGAAAYSTVDLPAYGAHWRSMAAMDDQQLEQWWLDYTSQPLVWDPK